MSCSVLLRPLVLSLLLLAPAPFFALLCRGRTPSRFETANLPVWERHPPLPAPPSRFFRLIPPPPGAIQIPGNPWLRTLLRTDENRLLAGVERPGAGAGGAAGDWLEAACAWGRASSSMAAKQDRVAARVMAAQADDGTFGLPPHTVSWTPPEAAAQRSCLRGLLAYYAASRQPAAIHAAITAGERIAAAAGERPDPAWVYPLVQLSQEADEPRFLLAARRQALLGSVPDANEGIGFCTLYEATGQPGYLRSAEQAWARNPNSPALAAEMLLLTGKPGYAAALDRLPPAGPTLARAAWTRAPLGLAVNTARESTATIGGLHLSQRTIATVRTITVRTVIPTAAKLRVFLPPGPAFRVSINGKPQTVAASSGTYLVLTRRWRNEDRVEIRPGAK